jgi:hypothetical protein
VPQKSTVKSVEGNEEEKKTEPKKGKTEEKKHTRP